MLERTRRTGTRQKKRLTSFRVRRLILFWNKSTQNLLYKSENWDIEQPVSVGVNLKKCLSDRWFHGIKVALSNCQMKKNTVGIACKLKHFPRSLAWLFFWCRIRFDVWLVMYTFRDVSWQTKLRKSVSVGGWS